MSNIIRNKFKQSVYFKTISSIFSWILAIFLVCISCFLLFYFYDLTRAKATGSKQNIALYSIISPSMEPNLLVYDVVFNIRPKTPEEVEVGDVITFISTSNLYSTRLITHRVIGITEVEGVVNYRTQGDNNISPDDTLVPFDNIVGEVVFKIPQLGRVQFLLSSVGGWLILIILPAGYVLFSDIFKLKKLIDTKEKVDNITKDEPLDEKEKKEEVINKLREKYNLDDKPSSDVENTDTNVIMLNNSIEEENREFNVVEEDVKDQLLTDSSLVETNNNVNTVEDVIETDDNNVVLNNSIEDEKINAQSSLSSTQYNSVLDRIKAMEKEKNK